MRANCPQLVSRPVQVPALTTLRTTGGGQGGAEPPRAQGRAFQLTVEEVRAEPDAAAGMSPFCYLVVIMEYCISASLVRMIHGIVFIRPFARFIV